MKTLLTTMLTITVLCLQAQNKLSLKEAYRITSSEKLITLGKNESQQVTISIERRRFLEGKPIEFKVMSGLPEGVTVDLINNPSLNDSITLQFSADESVNFLTDQRVVITSKSGYGITSKGLIVTIRPKSSLPNSPRY